MYKKTVVVIILVAVVASVLPVALSYLDGVTDRTDGDVLSAAEKCIVTLNTSEGIVGFETSSNGTVYTEYTGPVEVVRNSNIYIKAIVETGYTFVQWADGSSDNPLWIRNIKSDLEYNPVAAVSSCSVNPASDGKGYVITAITGSTTVDIGGDYQFVITLSEGYDQCEDRVSVLYSGDHEDLSYSRSDGEIIVTVMGITTSGSMTVSDVTINVYSISGTLAVTGGSASGITVFLDTPSGNYSSETASDGSYVIHGVPYGSRGTITVSADGYTQTVAVSVALLKSDLYDKDVDLGIDTYSVILPSGTGYSVQAYGDSSSPVDHGGSYSFTVTLDAGYDQSSMTVRVNGTAIESTDAVYTITDVTSDQTVTIEGLALNTYSVVLPSGTGYSVQAYGDSSSPVDHGGSYVFTVEIGTGYDGSSVIVKVNDNTITKHAGVYTLSGITADQTVTIQGVEKEMYVVSETEVNATVVIVSGVADGYGEYGTDIVFTAEEDVGYTDLSIGYYIGAGSFIEITSSGGYYTVPGAYVTDYVTIVASSYPPEAVTYTVTFVTGEGYSYCCTEPVTVQSGGSVDFMVLLDEDYSESSITVRSNGTVIDEIDGMYVISNITSDQTVTTDGVELDVHTVTPAEGGTGYSVQAVTQSDTILCEDDYEFIIALEENYDQSTSTISVDYSGEHGVVESLVSGNTITVTIPNITSDGYVSISGIYENVYVVSLPSGDGYSVVPAEGSSSPVVHGGAYSFTVTLTEGYDLSSATVRANDTELDPEDGVYTISDIVSDQTITVTFHTYDVSGNLNVEGEASVNGVNVFLNTPNGNYESVTSSDGSYVISNVPYGSSGTVVANITGYTETVKPNVQSLESDAYGEDITLEINTSVIDLTAGEGISGFLISTDGNEYTEYTSETTIEYGNTIRLMATTETGYAFLSWENGVTDNPYIIPYVSGDVSHTATAGLTIRTIYVSDDHTATSFVSGVVDNTTSYGSYVVFTVSVDAGYTDLTVGYTVDSGNYMELTADDNGRYTIAGTDILGNIVVVSAAYSDELPVYTVTVSSGEGYSVICGTSLKVSAEDSLSFRVVVSEGYELIEVDATEGIITNLSSGYVLSSISGDSDVNITVSRIDDEHVSFVCILLAALIIAVVLISFAVWKYRRED